MNNRIRNLVTGICLIIIAIGLVLWKLGKIALHFTIAGVGGFWLIVAIVVAAYIIACIIDLNFSGIFFPLAVLAIIFREPLGITALTPWIVLIVAGLLTVAYEKIFPDPIKKGMKMGGENYNEVNGSKVYYALRFGETTKYIKSDSLEEAALRLSFGSMSAYFDKVSVPCGQITINTKTSFGETVIYVPKEWDIDNHVSVIAGENHFGGAEPQVSAGSVHCTINGSVRFGELLINRI